MNSDYLMPFAEKVNYAAIQELRQERKTWLERESSQPYAEALHTIPTFQTSHLIVNQDTVTIGNPNELSKAQQIQLPHLLKALLPWRKGPFEIFGVPIDSEWQSYLKWNRIAEVFGQLEGKRIADIGCNNGYYMFRMASHHPQLVIGFDPTARYWYTFQFLQRFAQIPSLRFELLGVEHLPLFPSFFDIVFCLGIIYHHPDPIGLLKGILASLKPGGQLILESQGIPGEMSIALFPEKRYGKVPGTWFVPTASCLKHWIERAGFRDARLFCSHQLTHGEQRSTEWAPFQSLSDFLDPEDPSRTVEGYPAPWRHYVTAIKPH